MPDVDIYEVGPRDGLQNEAEFVQTERKLELIGKLAAAGLRRIEVASFVSAEWIPPLADGEQVAANLPVVDGVTYAALVPNEKGYARFRSGGKLAMAATFISASETHNHQNVNCSIADQLERSRPVFERAQSDGVEMRAYVSTVCGCPWFDSSLGGLGGCPYAPGASGNVATEDLVDLFECEGVTTGVDLDGLVDASSWLEREVLHRPLPGRVYRARLGARERAARTR